MSLRTLSVLVSALLVSFAVSACGEGNHYGDHSAALGNAPVGLGPGLGAEVVIDGLMNPSSVAFRGTTLTVCDSGNGKIVALKPGAEKAADLVAGFATEYWKPGTPAHDHDDHHHAATPDRFKLGPLSHSWLPGGGLVVSDSGHKDGKDRVAFFAPFEGSVKADAAAFSNGISKTSTDALDHGEGNLTGFALSRDGRNLWVAGQGADAKSWVLSCDVATRTLVTRFSADEHGIKVNSPMDIFVMEDESILVLYSGAGGVEDGLIVHWSLRNGPIAQWTLPGIKDPMGFDQVPGTNEFVVVDNNWHLKRVLPGTLSRIRLPAGGGAAEVELVASRLLGPVSCRFGPDGRLFVAQLGAEYDAGKGQVLAISGL